MTPHRLVAAGCLLLVWPAGVTGTAMATPLGPDTAAPPRITAAPTPKSDDLHGGNRVTVTGTGFTQVTSVRFGNTPGTALSVSSATSLTITAPAHPAGYSNIRVFTTHGVSAITTADRFQYVAPPVVTKLSSSAGVANSGMNGGRFGNGYVVRVYGTGFADLGSHLTGIYFGRPQQTPHRAQYVTYAASSAAYVSVFAPSTAASTVDVTVVTDYGTSAAVTADHYTYVRPSTRSLDYQPQQIVETQGGYLSVSCATSTFCLGVDEYGNAARYNGTSWSAPTAIEAGVSGTVSTFVASCAAPAFCAVLDPDGNAVTTSDGRTFSAPVPIASGAARPTAVSCASATFCLATSAARDVYRYDGTSWGAATELTLDQDGSGLAAISCSSPTFCMAGTDSNGHLFRYDGSTWTASERGVSYGFQSIDCSSHLRCVILSDTTVEPQIATIYNGATNTYGSTEAIGVGSCEVDGDDCYIDTVAASCGATNSCVAVSDYGSVYSFDGTSWTAVYDATGGSSVSCSGAAFCVAASNERARTYDGSTWSPLSLVDPETRSAELSCPTTTRCVGVSQFGASVSVLDGNTWGTPLILDARINTRAFPPSVSCASTTFCALTFRFEAFVWDGTTWSAARTIDDRHVTHVSCASNTFCAATDSAGRALVYNGSSWSKPVTIAGGAAIASLSCAGDAFCAAAYGGDIVTYSAGRWSSPRRVTGPLDLTEYTVAAPQVSCTSTTFCATLNGYQAATFDGSSWSPAYGLATEFPNLMLLSCASSTFCSATGYGADDQIGITGFVFDGTTWGVQRNAGHYPVPNTPAGLSCAAADHCVLGLTDYGFPDELVTSNFRGGYYYVGT